MAHAGGIRGPVRAQPQRLSEGDRLVTIPGFQRGLQSAARNWIGFSGTVGQIQTTFHVEIHRYIAAGETHYANATDPEIPAALAPVVLVIRGLDDFRLKPGVRNNKPHFTTSDGTHAVGPADLATIYDINPLYQAGITGSGQTIAIVGQTNIQMSDIENFRSTFGLSANDPQLVLVAGFPDPGITQDEGEADLDLEYAGGIAQDAQLLYVYSTDVVVSVQYAIDQALAPIVSMSYGGCEQKNTSGPESVTAIQSFAQQANAQGITWVASAGDPGAAGCEEQQVDIVAVSGPAVQSPASTPEVTGVGGLEFNDGNGSGYWNTTYDSHGGSAVSYIPEMVWNDTALEGDLAAGGGGASVIFPKPAWQTGPGVPNDNARDVPDVAFTASWDHDPYILFTGGNIIPNGGTSAATPSFAGMLALLNQYLVSNGVLSGPGLGNINPTLYTLAQNTTNVFHDITVGSNIVPCAAGRTGCDTGSYGYSAGPGYDQASGLGSIDVSNLARAWAGSSTKPSISATNVTAVADPASIVASATTVLTATVTAATGSASLTGSVSFSLGQTALGSANLSGAGGAAIASLTVYGSQLPVGDNMITVSYSGCNGFAASSGSVAVTVSVPTASSAIIPSVVPNPVYEEEPDSDGYSWFYTVKLTEIAGVSTTLNRFSIDANDYSADIDTWFGSTTIPANGTLSADIRSKLASVPVNRVFILGGVDASGQSWTQQISVPFYGKQVSAAMTLSSSPSSEIQNPNGDPNCDADYPYYQQLNLQELNGYEIHLTRFLAGGNDFSGQIAEWFGSWRLAPLGALQAGICWKLDNAPVTLSYEIDGVDTDGNEITATLSVPFQGPQQSAGGLSASEDSVSMAADVSQSATANVAVNVSSAEKWSVSVFPANQNSRLAGGVSIVRRRFFGSKASGFRRRNGERGLHSDAGLSIGEHHSSVRERANHLRHWGLEQYRHRGGSERSELRAGLCSRNDPRRIWTEPCRFRRVRAGSPSAVLVGRSVGHGQRSPGSFVLCFPHAIEYSNSIRNSSGHCNSRLEPSRASRIVLVRSASLGAGDFRGVQRRASAHFQRRAWRFFAALRHRRRRCVADARHR